MPIVLHGPTVRQDAADLAAYLSADAPPPEPWPAADASTVAHGGRLFTALGCVACHVAPAMDDSDPTLNRLSLGTVKAKFTPAGLAEWLRAPEAHYAWVKMPNFRLSDADAAALSAWIVSRCKDDVLPPAAAGDAGRGKALFASAGCMSCHAGRDNATPVGPSAVDLSHADWTRGCLAGGKVTGHAVDYAFTPDQLGGLRAMAATDWRPTLATDPSAEFAARQMVAVRCNACHHIDDADSAWSTLDGDVSAIESSLPPKPADEPEPQGGSDAAAADVGRREAPPAVGRVVHRRPRHVQAAAVDGRPHAQLRQSGRWPRGRAGAGARVAGDGRVACRARPEAGRHRPRPDRPDPVRLRQVPQRGRPGGHRPVRGVRPELRPRDRSPAARLLRPLDAKPADLPAGHEDARVRQCEGKTPYTDILGGDATAEYEAIWQYLLAGDKIVPAQ